MTSLNQTAHHILDVAERYTQTRGFNAFSYRDIQNELGIKTSSIHYYFPTKHDLAAKMLERYLTTYNEALHEIDESQEGALDKLQALGDIFITAVKEEKFCLCGMLATEILTMPQAVANYLRQFFQLSEVWIADVIRQGLGRGEMGATVSPETAAAHFLAMLEGGMLIARTRQESAYLQTVITEALSQLKA